ncbi:NapC/NirT family cytochrome c [Azospirillum sp. ST 5-10]|uniref:NapC/NirT family cytochrome c n=1 Tax=unclassified Azospirillum TaxID=2630922 RepID=UPI003F49D5D0
MIHPLAVVFRFLKRPAATGLVGVVGLVLGILFWGGFNTALEITNNVEFCISCHEMRDTVYQEYKSSVHFQNPSGVRAGCPDCHVPREWGPKVLRKIQATNELYHKAMGTIATPERFEAKRLELAKHEWARMKANYSRASCTAPPAGPATACRSRPITWPTSGPASSTT